VVTSSSHPLKFLTAAQYDTYIKAKINVFFKCNNKMLTINVLFYKLAIEKRTLTCSAFKLEGIKCTSITFIRFL